MTVKDIIKITLNLVIIYVIGGLILAGVYAKTSPIMFQNAKKAKEAALKALLPDADTIVKAGDWEVHEKHAEYFIARKCGELKINQVKDEKTGKMKEEKECIDPQDIGYVVESFGKGYSSYIDTFIATDKDFVVQKINILHHAETPGLGDEIEMPYFKDQFKGKDVDHLKVLKSETTDYIQAISGATISSRAVTEDSVKHGVEFLTKAITEGGAEHGGQHGE